MERHRYPDGLVHGVVVACRREDGRWLLIRRSAQVAAPLQICFPGGGIEPGEEHAQAAVREFQEELNGLVTPRHEIWVWLDPHRPLKLFGWTAQLHTHPDALQPNPAEVAEMLWLTAGEIAAHPEVLRGTNDFVAALECSGPPSAVVPAGAPDPAPSVVR